jgi:Cu2+-exporting ATPase
VDPRLRYRCAGQSVPQHLRDPLLEHHAHPLIRGDRVPKRPHPVTSSPPETMGHESHGDMSIDDMVHDMRKRSVVVTVFSAPILCDRRSGDTCWASTRRRHSALA